MTQKVIISKNPIESYYHVDASTLLKPIPKNFIQSYISFLDDLAAKYNSKFWWVTYISTKNRFISKLLPHLFVLHSIIEIIESHQDINITNLPEPIKKSLKKYCQSNDITCADFTMSSPPIFQILKKNLSFIILIWYKIFLSHRHKKITHNKYYVIRTWYYENSTFEQDSYFGQLPQYISTKKPLLIIAGIIGNYRKILKNLPKNIIPQEYFYSYLDPIRAIFDIHKNKIKIEQTHFKGVNVTDIIKAEISNDYYLIAPMDYIYYYFAEKLAKTIEIDTFLFTYENNAWERMCILALQGKTKIYGYQHTLLSPSKINMTNTENCPFPDKIITIGNVTKAILEKNNFKNVVAGCSLKAQNFSQIPRKHGKNILIVPEGVIEESVKMSNFVHDALENCDITLRLHPALPYKKIKRFLTHTPVVSPNTLQQDLENADIVIYRGSTVCVEALVMGIPVIYIDFGDILSTNPINAELSWIVKNSEELRGAIEKILGMNDDDYEKKLDNTVKYLKHYIIQVNEKNMQEFL